MPAYTENELRRMRERAIASAKEMQKRTAIKESGAQCKNPEPPKTPEPQKPQNPPAPPADDDKLLLLSLIIILAADGADMLLIFALMYILM